MFLLASTKTDSGTFKVVSVVHFFSKVAWADTRIRGSAPQSKQRIVAFSFITGDRLGTKFNKSWLDGEFLYFALVINTVNRIFNLF
jgi:hypothetical protein